MRRNGNRMGNRGGPHNRGMPNDRNFGNGSLGQPAGPLMTDHLQLHAGRRQLDTIRNNLPQTPALLDLDLELELLKRKREIIEKQQTMLLNESRFAPQSNQFNVKPSQGYGSQFNQTRNFSNFYDDAAGSQFNHFDRQQSLKRSAADGWNDGPAPKHYGGPSRRGQGPRRPDPFPKQNTRFDQKTGSGPASQPRGQGHRRPTPAHLKNKVTKPKRAPASGPNKLAEYPVNERKTLIAQTAPLTSNTRSAPPRRPAEILFLKANEIPSPKLLGRLELALGNILRELRDQFGAAKEYAEIFRSSTIQRAIKQVIRERIRDAMLNKPVGACAEIVNMYRKKFPKDTDLELITNARDTCKNRNNLVIELIESADPEKYFKLNYERLLNVSLTKMFEKVAVMYESEPSRNKVSAEIMENIIIDLESDPDCTKDLEMTKVETKTDGEDANKTAETLKEEQQAAQGDNDTVQKVEKTDQMNETTENAEVKGEIVEENADNTNENAENAAENATIKPENATMKLEAVDKESVQEALDSAIDESLIARQHIGEPVKAKFFVKLIDSLLKKTLPLALPKYKEYMINILDADEEFKKTKAYLITSAYKKAHELATDQNGQPDASATEGGAQPPYFVKILGRPTLPNKRLMKKFLDKFRPSLIKKHKVLHNVLYVSFAKKEDFDNILTMTGALIASTKLDIRVSENINKRKGNPNQNASNASANSTLPSEESQFEDNALNESLDNQITDLLTSIREEEESKENNEDEGEQQVEAENVEDANTAEEEEVGENEAEGNTAEAEAQEDEAKDNGDNKNEEENAKEEVAPKEVDALKNEGNPAGRATPTRASSRIATSTPSTIRTRRASKLAQN